jgi:FMN phosphatase YigB (HAD superfamily)
MTLTLLLDLDDTLLGNDINIFLPAYLSALGKHMIEHVDPNRMVQQLLFATKEMIENNNPGLTLEQTFDKAFYPPLSLSKEAMRAVLEQFYDEIFPGLQSLTQYRPAAVKLAEWAKAKGHTVVVATNPIFPRKAILHRLRWAGLDPDHVPFRLITDYERFHFAKPNPAFVAEVLAQLGWPAQPTVMIGNSYEEDLIPAAQLGLPVFWITDPPVTLPESFHGLSAGGSLEDIPEWIEKVDAAGLRQEFSTPQAMLAVLKSTPAAFDTFGKQLNQRQWRERPEQGEWSLTEIFSHLRDVDLEVNIPRLEKVMTGSMPFLAGVNTDRWTEERDYASEDGQTALDQFIAARTRLVEQLENLSAVDWQREARHAIFGPTHFKELVGFIATHDQSHIQQAYEAARTLAD